MKNHRYLIAVLGIFGVLLIAYSAMTLNYSEDIVSRSFGNVKLIKVENTSSNLEHFIYRKDEMQELYNMIKSSRKIEVRRHPGHSESITNDSPFIIVIIYEDGHEDVIGFFEIDRFIYRKLDTVGSSGDEGYVQAENLALLDYLIERYEQDDE